MGYNIVRNPIHARLAALRETADLLTQTILA